MKYIVHNAAGTILRTGECPDDQLALQARTGETVIEGEADDRCQRIEAGHVVGMPARVAPTSYAKERALAYPAIGVQLDSLWHAMDAGDLPKIAAFYDPIAAVKAAHPKE